MLKILVVGTGGLARELAEWFEGVVEFSGFASKNPDDHKHFHLPGKAFPEQLTPEEACTDFVVIAIGTPRIKEKISAEFHQRGFRFPSLVHPTAVIARTAEVGKGVVISPKCIVAAGADIEEGAYLNFGSCVSHEAKIGKFCQLNPNALISGGAKLGDRVLVGSNATILQGLTVGSDATLAPGSVIFANVAKNATMMGNPAKRMRVFEKMHEPNQHNNV